MEPHTYEYGRSAAFRHHFPFNDWKKGIPVGYPPSDDERIIPDLSLESLPSLVRHQSELQRLYRKLQLGNGLFFREWCPDGEGAIGEGFHREVVIR